MKTKLFKILLIILVLISLVLPNLPFLNLENDASAAIVLPNILSADFPDPFNPLYEESSIKIESIFGINCNTLNLKIFDKEGESKKEWQWENVNPTTTIEVKWNGKDKDGNLVEAGNYIYTATCIYYEFGQKYQESRSGSITVLPQEEKFWRKEIKDEIGDVSEGYESFDIFYSSIILDDSETLKSLFPESSISDSGKFLLAKIEGGMGIGEPFGGFGLKIQKDNIIYLLAFCTYPDYSPNLFVSYDKGSSWQVATGTFGGVAETPLGVYFLWLKMEDIGFPPWEVQFLSGVVDWSLEYEIADETETIEIPIEKWSFAVITDLHIGSGDSDKDYGDLGWNDDASGQEGIISTRNLREAVNLINSNKDKYNIDFVVVTGDFSDSAELSELNKAKEILDTLQIPWVPIIGNHDVWPYYGANPVKTKSQRDAEMAPEEISDKYFNDLFNSQYEKLKVSGVFQNWEKTEVPIWNPEVNPQHNNYFQNFAFDYKGHHFISLDFNARDNAPCIPYLCYKGVWSEGDLHNFLGGTWNWFINHLQNYLNLDPTSTENIILLAHHPFNKGIVSYMGFSETELDTMYDFLKDYKDNIYAEFAGHTHQNRDRWWYGNTMKVIETDANKEDPLVRLVQVYPDGKIDYFKMLPEKTMYIKSFSPVDLEVTDPEGFKIDKDTNQIPGASYIEIDIDEDGSLDDLITIPERKLGDYKIKVIPEPEATSTDTYTLEVSIVEDSFGYIPIVLAENTPISEIPTEPYVFESKEKIATQLVYDKDINGQYSDSVSLSATLTDENNNPLSGKNIIFEIGEQSTSIITDENGIATASLVLNQIPGKYYFVEASFDGDEDYLPAFTSQPFEILKENVIIGVLDKEGFYDDNITLEADVRDDDGQLLLKDPEEVEIEIGNQIIGTTTINELGKAEIDWKINLIPQELTETYSILVTFAGNEYYNLAEGQATFTLKSTNWLKQDAVSELEEAKTGDKKTDQKIDKIIWFVNQSLDENLWLDASHLVFLEKGFKDFNEEEFEEMFDKSDWTGPKSGISVFHYEKVAVRLMMPKPKFEEFELSDLDLNEFKDWKIPNELKPVFEAVIRKLIKADILLAKVSLFDAKNTEIQNPKFQKIVDRQIEKAEKELKKAYQELEKGRPDKAIMRLSKAWLHSQLAIKFANLEKNSTF